MSEQKKEILKCILMDAGLIDYKLCQLGYDCEQCPFYNQMVKQMNENKSASSHSSVSFPAHPFFSERKRLIATYGISSPILRFLESLINDLPLFMDRAFLPEFYWIRERNNQVEVGLDPLFKRLLPSHARIILKDSLTSLSRGQLVGYIVFNDFHAGLHSPVSGTVTPNFNSGDISEGQCMEKDVPIFSIQTPEQNILFSENAFVHQLKYYSGLIGITIKHLEAQLTNHALSLQDGGTTELDMYTVLGNRNYLQYIRNVLKIDIL